MLPDDPIPPADAIVSVGHVLNYLPDGDAVDRALANAAHALRPSGLLVLDLCDMEYGRAHGLAPYVRVEHDWAIMTRCLLPSRERFVREITTFLRRDDGCWRRDDERHENTLVDASRVPHALRPAGVDAVITPSFGTERLPPGLVAVVGRRV